jgi:hypothetical protein
MATSVQGSRWLSRFLGGILGLFTGVILTVTFAVLFLFPPGMIPFADDGLPLSSLLTLALCLLGTVAGLAAGIIIGGRR